jgi:hypothetical protein
VKSTPRVHTPLPSASRVAPRGTYPFVDDLDDDVFPCGNRRAAERDHREQSRRDRLKRFIAS